MLSAADGGTFHKIVVLPALTEGTLQMIELLTMDSSFTSHSLVYLDLVAANAVNLCCKVFLFLNLDVVLGWKLYYTKAHFRSYAMLFSITL